MNKISKKSIVLITISCKLMLAVLFSLTVLGCVGKKEPTIDKPGTFENLSLKMEKEIIQTYTDDYNKFTIDNNLDRELLTVDNVEITDIIGQYFGNFNGCVVFIGRGHTTSAPSNFIIANTLFSSSRGIRIDAWKEGHFYALHEVYEQGFLTQEDLRKTAYQHHEGRELNLENHAGLRFEVIASIIDNYYNTYLKPLNVEVARHDIQLERYYGSYNYYYDDIPSHMQNFGLESFYVYNDHVAVMLNANLDKYDNTPWETTVAGTLFSCNSGNKILIWKIENLNPHLFSNVIAQGSFYELEDAYNLGFLTEDCIKNIAYYHENEKWISYSGFSYFEYFK